MDDIVCFQLHRHVSTEQGTFSEWLNVDGNVLCYTVELPWNDNEPDKSCIPTGDWLFSKFISPKHGQVWKAENIPGRSNIEIHAANFASELLGCIGVGDGISIINGTLGVTHSDDTLDMLRGVLPDEFVLSIQNF